MGFKHFPKWNKAMEKKMQKPVYLIVSEHPLPMVDGGESLYRRMNASSLQLTKGLEMQVCEDFIRREFARISELKPVSKVKEMVSQIRNFSKEERSQFLEAIIHEVNCQ